VEREKGKSLAAIAKEFFGRRTVGAWVWRIAVAAVAFVPLYLFFGSLVAPITAEYYQQGIYGLRQPSWDEILVVLFVRSVLFLLACLPTVVMWQRSKRSLFLSLGFALFVLVGFLYMLGAYYMPLNIRIPHTLEILADSFTHAGVLVVLLAKGGAHLVQTAKEPDTVK
jgi:tryptophan-rich sensory protein